MLDVTPHLLHSLDHKLPIGTVVSFYGRVASLTESNLNITDLVYTDTEAVHVLLTNLAEIDSAADEGVIVYVVASVSESSELNGLAVSCPDPQSLGEVRHSMAFIEDRARMMLEILKARETKII